MAIATGQGFRELRKAKVLMLHGTFMFLVSTDDWLTVVHAQRQRRIRKRIPVQEPIH
jgi:hypothetical protein